MTDDITIPRELLRQVLDALEDSGPNRAVKERQITNALRSVLVTAPVQEPLTVHQIRLSDATWSNCSESTFHYHNRMGWKTRTIQVAHPRKAVKLTHLSLGALDEIYRESFRLIDSRLVGDQITFARAIEQAVRAQLGVTE